MKKVLFLVLALLVPFGLLAATAGNGTVTVSPETAGTGANFTFNEFTFTCTVAANNMSDGQFYFKLPTGWATGLTMTTTGGNMSSVTGFKSWTDAGSTYHGVEAVGTVGATFNIVMSVTVTTVAEAYTFTFYTADATKNTYSASAIATNPAITVASSNNPITWLTLFPALTATPVILTTEKSKLVYTGQFNQAVSGGQIIFNLDPGNNYGILASTRPSPLTWVAQALTSDKSNAVVVNARVGVFASPTCNGTQCIVPILTAAAEETFEIIYGRPTATPALGPQGAYYSDGVALKFRSHAYFPAATVTPQAMPTAFYNVKGKVGHLVMVATPTVVMTPVYNGDKVELRLSGWSGSDKKVVSSGNTLQLMGSKNSTNSSYMFNPAPYGSYSITGILGWTDELNDNLYRTNTSNAVVQYKLPEIANVDESILNGLIQLGYVENATVKAAAPLYVTIFASDTYVYDADIFGNSAAVFYARTVGEDAANVTYTSYVLTGVLPTAKGFSNYIIPAEDLVEYDLITGDDNEFNLRIMTVPLPTR